ncbi:hypothetical protein [Streptomyces montanisoli]|uniref:Uncharacterized protein n=1 Tax=Streptomyces montanisoli TaxID=2798581 RepID=A0A940MCK5_9ACTN|nr:hypothetical protein [Streptomyces montanisoli]MBP0456228.1 hypothetical protein [Streptomyces montanisoli]
MNHHRKHPDRPFRRRAIPGDHTPNSSGYRVTASWDARPDRPAIRSTPDRKKAARLAREYADQGAYVLFEQHRGHNRWRTLAELDGRALLAERRAEQQLAAEQHPATPAAYRPGEPDRHRTWLDWMRAKAEADQRARADADRRRRRLAAEATTHARALMTPPDTVRPDAQRRARHVTGAQR